MAEWQRMASQYKTVYDNFARVRASLLKRRQYAPLSGREEIDEQLKRNDLMRESIRAELEIAQKEIERMKRAARAPAPPANPDSAQESQEMLKRLRGEAR